MLTLLYLPRGRERRPGAGIVLRAPAPPHLGLLAMEALLLDAAFLAIKSFTVALTPPLGAGGTLENLL